jgi:hypothetical protein
MLLIAKHRNGELGEIPLRFIHEQTKIINYYENNKPNNDYLEINQNFLNNKTSLTKEEKDFFESNEEELLF